MNSKKLFAKKRRTAKVNSRKYLNLTYSTIQNNQEVEDSVKSCKVRACVSHVFLSFCFVFVVFFPRKTSMSDVRKAPPSVLQLKCCFISFRFLEGRDGVRFTVEGGGKVWADVEGHSLQWSSNGHLSERRQNNRREGNEETGEKRHAPCTYGQEWKEDFLSAKISGRGVGGVPVGVS